MKIMLKDAKREDADKLSEIALTSKRYWNYPESWISLWAEELEVKPDFIENNKVLIAEYEGASAGFAALTISDKSAELGHLWILPLYMKKGIGKFLFESIVKYCKEKNINRFKIVSDPYAKSFYEKMGAQQIGFIDSIPKSRKLPLFVFEI